VAINRSANTLAVQTSKEIGFMTGITVATHGATATTAFNSRRVSAALAAAALLVMALLVALLLAVQSGHSTPATALPTHELAQRYWGIDQAPEPGYVRGRPY
jgi:hypothetical protein